MFEEGAWRGIFSSLTKAPSGMGGTVPSSLSTARDGMLGCFPWPSSSLMRGGGADATRFAATRPSGERDAQRRLLGGGEAAQIHLLDSP